MPVALCCNSEYSEAKKWLKLHEGFGGDLEISQNFEEIPRFVYGAKLLQEYSPQQDPIEFSFSTLDAMSNNVRWSIVFDVNAQKVYFKTNLNQEIRAFVFTPEDFSLESGPLFLNIESSGSSNVRNLFKPYDEEIDRELIKSVLDFFCKDPQMRTTLLDEQNIDIDGLARGLMEKIKVSGDDGQLSIQSSWAGNAKYPTSDGYMEVPMTLEIFKKNNRLSGTANDNTIIKNLAISNVSSKGGFLSFTISVPETKDLLYYQLYASTDKLTGSMSILGKNKKAIVNLKRN